MLRIKTIIHDRNLMPEIKYEKLLLLITQLDGMFLMNEVKEIVYIPNKIELRISGGIVKCEHNGYNGNQIIKKIVKNDQDNEVGTAIARRLNYIDDVLTRKIMFEKDIKSLSVRNIMKRNNIGYEKLKQLLAEARRTIITYMCFSVSEETLKLIKNYENICS